MWKHLRTCTIVFVSFALVGLTIVALDRSTTLYWVGSTNLEVEFVVVDSESSQPIPGARIRIHSEGGLHDGGNQIEDFELVTDAMGSARRSCLNNRCHGGESGLRFRDFRSVHLPHWPGIRVAAHGYVVSDTIDLVEDYWGKTCHDGPGKDRLVVRVPLKKVKE